MQAQLGHSTIVTTFDTYGHLFEGHLDEAMDRLDTRWRQAEQATEAGGAQIVRLREGDEALRNS